MDHKCKKCGKVFPFYSQLKIHRLSHTKTPKFTCDKCYQPYKFRYDMLKHKKQHTAPTMQCSTCEYEGTPLALKEHTRQHDPSKNIICKICFNSFTFRCPTGGTKNFAKLGEVTVLHTSGR